MRLHWNISCTLLLLFWEGGFLWASDCPTGSIVKRPPIFYFGESINLTCSLDPGKSHQVLSESKLYFKSSKLKMDQDFRTLYGTPTDNSLRPGITIHDMVNQTASKKNKYMHYVCMYDSCYVDDILVEIEYKPKPPDSGSCVVYNWERMECYWDLLVEYRQLQDITDISVEYFSTKVEYSLTTEKWSNCPSMKTTGRNLTCIIKTGPGSTLFMGHYYFLLTVNNTKTMDSVSNRNEFMSDYIVKPARVESVMAVANRTSIHVKWSVNKISRPQLFRIRFTITPDLSQSPDWKEVNSSKPEVILRDLKPYRNYTIWIAAIPLVSNKTIGFWSDTTPITNNTLQDVPSEVPKMDPGFYFCVNINCTAVIIFWKQISKESKNGILTKYRIIKEVNGTQNPPVFIENPSATGYSVAVDNKRSTKILLNVATEVGFSLVSDSSLIVPPLHLKPPYPENIIVEALQSDYINISWTAPKTPPGVKNYTITNFSIMWCIGNSSGCKGEIDYEIVKYSNGKEFYWKNLSIPDSFKKYAFGISVDAYIRKTGRFISSGIHWSKCSYAVDAVPQEPVNIDPVFEDPETSNQTMLFTWTSYNCQKHHVGPVLNFTVKVCIIMNKTCQDSPTVVVLSGNQTSYRVKDLIEGKNYNITVTAGFKGGNSPLAHLSFKPYLVSSEKSGNGSAAGASGGVPLGVIIGSLAAVVAVAGFIFIAWRIRRCLKTSDRDTAIEIPNIKSGQEKSTAADSIQTENVPLLHSSVNQSSTPTRTIPNGAAISNMLDNPYYKSSEHYYTRVDNDTLLTFVSNNLEDHTNAILPQPPPNDSLNQSTDSGVEATKTEPFNQTSESGQITSGISSGGFFMDSYCRADPQTDNSGPLSSGHNVFTGGLSSNGSAESHPVNEFGYV